MRRPPRSFPRRAAAAAVPIILLSGGLAAEEVRLMPGSLNVFKPARAVKTIAIGKPEVADATVENARTIIITGKAAGSTSMVLLDEAGAEISHLSVQVGPPQRRVRILEGGAKDREFLCDAACSPLDKDDGAAAPALVITSRPPENGSPAAAPRPNPPGDADSPR